MTVSAGDKVRSLRNPTWTGVVVYVVGGLAWVRSKLGYEELAHTDYLVKM